MKQSISPAVMAIAIIVVVAVVAFIGYQFLGPGSKVDPNAMKSKYMSDPQVSGSRLTSKDRPAGASSMPPGAPPGMSSASH